MNHEAPGCELLMVRQAGAEESRSSGLPGPIDMLDSVGQMGCCFRKRFSKEGFSQSEQWKKKGPLVVLGYIGEKILYSYYMGIIS